MRLRILMVSLFLVRAAVAVAQEPQCQSAATPAARAACNTAVDAVRAFHPVAGMLVSGGNPVLASGGTLGGPGHVSISGRINAIRVSLPNPDSAAQSSVPSSFEGFVPAPIVDASVGALRGLGSGLLAVDVLGSAVLLPTGVDRMTVADDAARIGDVALGLGYGVRVGVLRGLLVVPSLSVSVMRRHVPRIQYGDVTAGDLSDFTTDLAATNVRVAAGLPFIFVDLAAGFGVDWYRSDARIRYDDLGIIRTVNLDLHSSRQVLFLDAGMSLGVGKLVAEVGYQTGKDQRLTTDFSDFDPSSGHVFWSAGVRFAF